ncbi:MAG: VanZ family protein [Blastocatellia bacterium]|nr:VanZ family protein [Blastocatellia bacterium]
MHRLAAKAIRYWLPVAVWMGVIYYFSTDTFSGDNTRGLIEEIFDRLFPGASSQTIATINYLTRKSAHFVAYAFLAVLLFRAFRSGSAVRWRIGWALYSLAVVVCWALLDEYHQSRTLTRGGSIYDSLLDISGGLFALIVIALLNRRSSRNESDDIERDRRF